MGLTSTTVRYFTPKPTKLPQDWWSTDTKEQFKQSLDGWLFECKAEHLYSALHGIQTTLKCSGMDRTVLPATNTMPALPRKRSPDDATTD